MFKKLCLILYITIASVVSVFGCAFEGTDNFGFTKINYSKNTIENTSATANIIPTNLPITFLFKFNKADELTAETLDGKITLIYSIIPKDNFSDLKNKFYLVPNAEKKVTKLAIDTPVTIFGDYILQVSEIKSKFPAFKPDDLIVVVCAANIGSITTVSKIDVSNITKKTAGPIENSENSGKDLVVGDIIKSITDGSKYTIKDADRTSSKNVLVLKYVGNKFIGK